MKLVTNSMSCRVSLILIIGLALITVTGTAAAIPSGLVLWNKLGSQSEIQNSQVGLGGTFSVGSYVAGMFGNAYSANYNEDLRVTFPKEVIPIDAGTIEFWAKLTGSPSNLDWGNRPYFVSISDGYSAFAIGLNGNDGAGDGGLVGLVGHIFTTGTGLYGSWTYEQVLGAGKVGDWHHYALVWDRDGIPGVGDGTKKVAVFLDGQLNSGIWHDYYSPSELVPLTGGKLGLIENSNDQGSVAIDNLKIWNYAKTDFSDRFVEGGEIGGEISGMKFNDLNGNGIHNAGEPGLANWTITLTNDTGVTITQTTALDGSYNFTNLTDGNYTVGEVIQSGWIQTAPAVSATGSATYKVQISGGNDVTSEDFGNFQLGSVSGTKFEDLNANSVRDSNESGLAGWNITINGTDSITGTTVTQTTTTDADGNYNFTGLTAGTYTISETLKGGWVQTAPPGGTFTVTITSGAVIIGQDFGNKQYSIYGMKFNDRNGNGKRDAGEEGLAGWHIKLVGYYTLTGTGVNREEITDANGNYGFMDVSPGIYEVYEVMQGPNWVSTTYPNVQINLKANENINVNFGNKQIP